MHTARPPQIEFPGALYHVTSRVNDWYDIFFTDDDRGAVLAILEKVCGPFNWPCRPIEAGLKLLIEYGLVVAQAEAGLLWTGRRAGASGYRKGRTRALGLDSRFLAIHPLTGRTAVTSRPAGDDPNMAYTQVLGMSGDFFELR